MPFPENKVFDYLMMKAASSLLEGLPFVVYRKPGDTKVSAIIQSSKNLYRTTNFNEKGFVFAPFDLNGEVILLKADEWMQAVYSKNTVSVPRKRTYSEMGKDDYIDLVEKSILEIRKGKLSKVVVSRKIEEEVDKEPIEIFKNLLDKYENAFCYLFFHPRVGVWCGATPETLLKVRDHVFQTVSLAGTLPYSPGNLPSWGTKEIEEQEMVTRYIEKQLQDKTDELQIDKALSARAGNLWHLKSEIQGKLLPKTTNADIIRALHPTPAVCGIPTADAKAFILANENYNRSYYTGFLGEMNLSSAGEMALYVNLRCMQIKGSRTSIFVGGGITAGSIPESEWKETQNKSSTLLNII